MSYLSASVGLFMSICHFLTQHVYWAHLDAPSKCCMLTLHSRLLIAQIKCVLSDDSL